MMEYACSTKVRSSARLQRDRELVGKSLSSFMVVVVVDSEEEQEAKVWTTCSVGMYFRASLGGLR